MKIKRILSAALTLILLLPGALPALAQENAAEGQVQTVEQKKPDCKDEEPANPKDTGESKTAESVSETEKQAPVITPSPTPSPMPTAIPVPEETKTTAAEDELQVSPVPSAEPPKTLSGDAEAEQTEVCISVADETAELTPESTDVPDNGDAVSEAAACDEGDASEAQTDIPGEIETSAEPSEIPGDAENTPAPEAAADEEGLRIADRQEADWRGVIPSDEAGLPIPRLYQRDYRQTVCYWNGDAKSVASSGCGATSVSMVIAYLTGNIEQNPYTLFRMAVKSGQYYGDGLGHHTLSMLAAEYGVNSEWIVGSEAAIRKALEAGKPIIAHMGAGNFTAEGHYIVLRGLTQNGLILVNDPNSRSNSHKAFPLKTILRQARTSASFMVCWI